MNWYLLLQQCSAYFVRLTWKVLEMRGQWSYSSSFLAHCFQDLFNIARSILLQFPSCFFSVRFVSVYVVHPFCSIDTTAAWKKSRLICSHILLITFLNEPKFLLFHIVEGFQVFLSNTMNSIYY